MDQDKSNVVADGAVDLELLRKMRFPQFGLDHVRDLAAWARVRGLDIWSNHVCAKLEPDTETGELVLKPMVQVEGLAALAHSTGTFVGMEDADIMYDGETPVKATAVVYREVNGKDRRFQSSAYFRNLYPGKGVSPFWDKMPETMIRKCAVAAALRLAFADRVSGLLCPEEASRTDLGKTPKAAPVAPANEVEDLPQDRTQLKLRMMEFGLKDDAHRDAVISSFRQLYRDIADSPAFYGSVFKAITANPEAYGGKRPTAE